MKLFNIVVLFGGGFLAGWAFESDWIMMLIGITGIMLVYLGGFLQGKKLKEAEK